MDIISLLEGLAHNDKVFFEFLNEMIKLHRSEATLQQYSLPSGTVIAFFGGSGSRGRNFTVTQPSSSEKLHFRFIGHHHLGDNCIGLPTVFHPVVMPELLCEMALIPPDDGDCRPAHILVLNSGQVREQHTMLGFFPFVSPNLAHSLVMYGFTLAIGWSAFQQ